MHHRVWLGCLLILCGVTGCHEVKPQSELKVGGPTMGTYYAVKVTGDYPGGESQLKQDVETLLRQVDHSLSTYKPDSELSRFNQFQSTERFAVSQELADVVVQALRVGQETGGAVDVTVGPLVNLWGFGPDKRPVKMPTDQQIAEAKARTGLDKLHVEIGSEQSYLRKDLPDMYIDLSTIGEGYAATLISRFLDRRGVRNYMVEIAGAIQMKGQNAKGDPWRVAIEKPIDELGQVQTVVSPIDSGISTAGSYRNYYERDGQRLSHVIDPRTGRPISHHLVSVTVISASAEYSDAIDTGLMVMGADQALQYANEHHLAIYTISKTPDGFKVRYSRAFQPYLPTQS